jgi:hypothetical protein
VINDQTTHPSFLKKKKDHHIVYGEESFGRIIRSDQRLLFTIFKLVFFFLNLPKSSSSSSLVSSFATYYCIIIYALIIIIIMHHI